MVRDRDYGVTRLLSFLCALTQVCGPDTCLTGPPLSGGAGQASASVTLGDHPPGALVSVFLELLLGKAGKRVSLARYGLDGGVDDESAALLVGESGLSSQPERVKVLGDPVEVGVALALSPLLAVVVLKSHYARSISDQLAWVKRVGCRDEPDLDRGYGPQ